MSRGLRSFAAFALGILQLCVTGNVAAQSRAARRHEPVALKLHVVELGTNVSVETADKRLGPKGRVVLQCKTVCETEVPRGIYKLILRRDGEATTSDSDYVSLQRPLQYTTQSVSHGLKLLGAGLFIAGAIGVGIGVVAAWPMILSSMCHGGSDECDAHVTFARIAAISGISGGVLAITGMLLYMNNKSSFKAQRLNVRERNLSMQLWPSTSGITGVVTATF